MNHAHVLVICRHCGNHRQLEVCETLEEAQKFLVTFPRKALNPPPEMRLDEAARNKLQNAKIVQIDENLMRMFLGPHDLIHFTAECGANFAECQQEHMMELFKHMVEDKLGNLMMRAMEGEMPFPAPNNSPETTRDTSSNILKQIDLPDDFFGPQPH